MLGWLSPDGEITIEIFKVDGDSTLTDTLLDAFAAGYRRAEAHEGAIRPQLWVSNGALRESLLECVASFPAVNLVDTSYSTPFPLVKAVSNAALDMPLPGGAAPRKRVLATDASRGARGGCGLAYISDDGKHSAWFTPVKNVSMAELFAIEKAVASFPDDDLTIFTDSQRSVDWIDGRLEPENWEVRVVAERIRAERQSRRVDVRWVRGHSGHHMNEIADRLATGVRRAVQGKITDDQWDVIRRGILADFHDAEIKVPA